MAERINQSYEEYYEPIERIGIGGYGYIYKGRDKNSKELRAKRLWI
jgi:hypothetical protein